MLKWLDIKKENFRKHKDIKSLATETEEKQWEENETKIQWPMGQY